MDDLFLVHVGECLNELFGHAGGFFLAHGNSILKNIKQRALILVLHDEIDVLGVWENSVKLDDVSVLKVELDFELSEDVLFIFAVFDFGFIHDFQGKNGTGADIFD